MAGMEKFKRRGDEPREEYGEYGGGSSQVDIEKVESIVRKMKKKYAIEGTEEYEGGRLDELRTTIAGAGPQIEVQRIEDLKEAPSPAVRKVGSIYLALEGLFSPFFKLLMKLPGASDLNYYLYSANMRYSAKQWLAITTTVVVLVGIIVTTLTGVALLVLDSPLYMRITLPLVTGIASAGFTLIIMLLIPRQRAKIRGAEISRELPFALRHIATQLSAGIGLYKTLQTIARSDYGALSEEFTRVITEIEEGVDTKDALQHLAHRTQSKALKSAVLHMIRALKTGGNLSELMNEIAEDVAFELRMKMRDFSEKMNFFGVIFIFMAIVLPVFVAILAAVRATPTLTAASAALAGMPLDKTGVAVIYLGVMPMVFVWLFMFIKMMQPKV
jgi:flagellar protein FlaJ